MASLSSKSMALGSWTAKKKPALPGVLRAGISCSRSQGNSRVVGRMSKSKSKDSMTIYDNKSWSGKKSRHGCTHLCKQHVRAANGNYKLCFSYPNFCWHETKRNSDSQHNHQIVKLQENQHESAFTNLQSKHVTLAYRSPVAALHLAVLPPKMDCWKSWLAIRQVDPEGQLPCLRVPLVTTRIDQGSW